MKKYKLKNKATLIIDDKKSDTVAIEIDFKVGSNYENDNNRGISHFIEHMMFTGTKKRNALQIASAIEKYGGEFNAATDNERTFYYVILPKKYVNVGIEILADMIKNTQFYNEELEKERKVLLNEISMLNDNPRFYQWILFQKNLFEKHPTKYPLYGSRETVGKIKREDLLDYFSKHYSTEDMIVSIVGDVKNIKNRIEKAFSFKRESKYKKIKVIEPKQLKIKEVSEKREIEHSYIVLGYKTVNRTHKDSYALDLLKIILGGGMSSRLFNEIRLKKGLAYSVAAQNESNLDFGYFAVYLSTDKKNKETVKNIILREFKKLNNINNKELNDAKNCIEGSYIIQNENNQSRANLLGYWEMIKDAGLAKDYIKNIKKVRLNDVKKVAKKYFNDYYTMAVVEQK